MPDRVLIVDDQKGLSRLLRSAIETLGHGLLVSEAPSGEEALLEARRTHFDLLIADFRLPGITGLELMKKFRTITPGGKVIIISGVAEPRMFREITEAAPEAFFAKPLPMSDFLATVENCLGIPSTVVTSVEKTIAPNPVQKNEMNLGDSLISLRKNLNAQAVLLLDGEGGVVAAAGELPDRANHGMLFSDLINLLGIANRAAGWIDHPERHIHFFGGDENDAILLPLGPSFALFLVGKGLSDAGLLAKRLGLIFAIRQELLDQLSRLQTQQPESEPLQEVPPGFLPIQPGLAAQTLDGGISPSSEAPVAVEEMSEDFLSLFDQLPGKKVDANSFWDSAVEQGTNFTQPDKLTYEQASRLGLTPDSAQDKNL